MRSSLNKLPDGTIELTITIPTQEIKKTWDEAVDELIKNTTIPGFRKGKAPKKLAEEQLDKSSIKEEVLKKLLPQTYVEAVREHNLKPILNPKIHVKEIENPLTSSGQADWQFTALTCEMPEVILDNYKESIQKVTAKAKIIIPGKEPEAAKFEDIASTLLEAVSIKIPKILLEGEVDRLLAQTLDEVKKLGLTLEQYLASTNRTVQGLKQEYERKAENDIKLEFTLRKIAEEEHIIVEEKEIEEAIQKAKDDEERKNLETNRYLLASILRQQKTLDFIINL